MNHYFHLDIINIDKIRHKIDKNNIKSIVNKQAR